MVSKDMTIEELVEKYPQTIKPLNEMGVKCIVCGEPVWGTIEENARSKGINDLDGIILKLNEAIQDYRS